MQTTPLVTIKTCDACGNPTSRTVKKGEHVLCLSCGDDVMACVDCDATLIVGRDTFCESKGLVRCLPCDIALDDDGVKLVPTQTCYFCGRPANLGETCGCDDVADVSSLDQSIIDDLDATDDMNAILAGPPSKARVFDPAFGLYRLED